MGGKPQEQPQENQTIKQKRKAQERAVKTAGNSSAGGKRVGAVGAQNYSSFPSGGRTSSLTIGGGTTGGSSSFSGAQGGKIGANVP